MRYFLSFFYLEEKIMNTFGMNSNNYNYSPYMNYRSPAHNGITWVMGISEAKAYPVGPGGTALLMDSEQPRFYIKTADNSGMCTMKAYEFKELADGSVSPAPTLPDMSKYVTKEELAQMLESLKVQKPLL